MSKNARLQKRRSLRSTLGAIIAFCLTAALMSSACAPRGKEPDAPRGSKSGPLDVDVSDTTARLDSALLARIRESPTAYFRFVNVAFGNEVCRRFQSQLPAMGVVGLHGDPHLQQYAITDTGRGLTDFDDAASGPPVLDLVRFGASLVLACRARGWDREIGATLQAFFHGYRSALTNPRIAAREPSVVARVRAGFRFDPAHYFGWLRSISDPLPIDSRGAVIKALDPYIDTMLTEEPTLTREYFRVSEIGRSRMGIGSARTRKYVVRLRGRTDSADDDDVLELKEVGAVPNVSCLSAARVLDPMRQIVAQEHIVYEPYRLVGHVVIDERYFWVHAWARSYHELTVNDLRRPEELSQVALDAGVQLGLGHPKLVAPPLDVELRATVSRFLDAHITELDWLSRAMADEVTLAWSRFRDQTTSEVRN